MFFYPVPANPATLASTAAGPTWHQVALRGTLVHFLVFSRRGPGLAFAGAGDGVYRRSGRGQNWTRVFQTGEAWGVTLLPDDRTVLAPDESGHLNISTDAGEHWRRSPVTAGAVYVAAAQPAVDHRVAVDHRPGSSQRLLVGGEGGLYLSLDGGFHWRHPLLLPKAAIAALIWAPGSRSSTGTRSSTGSRRTVFAGAVAGGLKGSTQVYVSRDAGLTWHTYGHDLQSFGGIMSLLAPQNGRLYAGTMGHATWRLAGPEARWTQVTEGMPPTNDHVAGLATLPGHPNTLFAGTLSQGVFRTDNAGRHWRNISSGLPIARNARIVLSVAYSPLDHALFAGTADGIYELPLNTP
jgi:photosystem II stability/assembly factor-like uncharacterized protein